MGSRASVGDDAHIVPHVDHRASCQNPCHCEPVTDVTGVAIRTPHAWRFSAIHIRQKTSGTRK